MAQVFSTATLGLKVDVKQFNKAMEGTSAATNDWLKGMALNAADFQAKLDSATAGIKDTKRIVSGILVSRGFYSLLEGLTGGAAAAISFAKNMETAAISMEYFVEGASKASKATAFIQTMNEFAAKTPFSSEQAMGLSKYIQSMGVSMNVVKSYLTVVTDAASATGATNENLQRITLALGQMMTKGRLANEEIRQLANANIPIYQILQDELKLTGAEISNIGTKWISADKAVVAILSGLEKRYKGAADRVSDTVTGMTDTIIDDLKIVSTTAGNFLYEGLSAGMTKVRDALDRYREIVTEFGAAGLAKQIMLDIDPSGQFGRQVLTTIGNIRHLAIQFSILYNEAKPIIGLIGTSLYSAFNVATITLTGFTDIATGLVRALEKLGITTGTVSEVIASLYITYTAAKWMITLGEGAYYAGAAIYQTVLSIQSIFPAAMYAQAGLLSLIGGLAGVAIAGAGVAWLINNMSSLAGLEVGSGTTISDDYTAAMTEYEVKMKEYNDSIKENASQFENPYTQIDDESTAAINAINDVDKASTKAAKNSKKEWLASFDEVYSIPRDTDAENKLADLKFPDLGATLTLPSFKFPEIKTDEITAPIFEIKDILDDKNTMDNPDVFVRLLPGLIAIGVTGALAGLGKGRIRTIRGKFDVPKIEFPDTIKLDILDPGKLKIEIDIGKVKLEGAFGKLEIDTDSLKKLLDAEARYLDGARKAEIDTANKQLLEESKRLREALDRFRNRTELLGSGGEDISKYEQQLLEAAEESRKATVKLLSGELASIDKMLKEAQASSSTTADAYAKLTATQADFIKRLKEASHSEYRSTDLRIVTKEDLKALLEDHAKLLADKFSKAFSAAFEKDGGNFYIDANKILGASSVFNEFITIGDKYAAQVDLLNKANISLSEKLYNMLKTLEPGIRKSFNTLLDGSESSATALTRLAKGLNGKLQDLPEDIQKQIRKLWAAASEAEGLLRSYNRYFEEYSPEKTAERERNAQELEAKRQAQAEKDAANKLEANRLEQERINKLKEEAQKAWEQRDLAGKADINFFLDRLAAMNGTQGGMAAADTTGPQMSLTEATRELKLALKEYLDGSTSSMKENKVAVLRAYEEYVKHGRTLNSLEKILKADVLEELSYIVQEAEALNIKAAEAAKSLASNENIYAAFNDALQKYLLPNPKLASSPEAAVVIVDAIKRLRGDLEFISSNFYASGTKIATLATGMSSFGTDIPALAANSFKSLAYLKEISVLMPSRLVQIYTAIGTGIEKVVAALASMNLVPEVGQIFNGGYLALDTTPLLVQLDTVLQLAQTGTKTFITMANDVKTKSAAAFKYLLDSSEEYAAGVRSISAELLKIEAPEQYYQFAAQAYTMNGGNAYDTMVGMSAFNRDFDFTEIDAALVKRWMNSLNRSSMPDDVGGKILSAAAVEFYGKQSEFLKSLSPGALFQEYFKEIILPLFANSSGFDFKILSNAFQQFVVKFSAEELKSLNLKGLADSFAQYDKLISTVVDNTNIADFLNGYITLNKQAGEEVVALNFASNLKSYGRLLSDGANKWATNILTSLGEASSKIKFSKGALGASIKKSIDTIINDYFEAVNNTLSIDEVNKISTSVSKRLSEIASDALNWAAGADFLNLGADDLFVGTTRNLKDMALLSDTLNALSQNLNILDEVPRTIVKAIKGIERINKSIYEGATLAADTIYGVATTVTRAYKLLGLSVEETGQEAIRQLERMYDIAARANGAKAEFGDFARIELPFNIANITKTLEYTAGTFQEALLSSFITLTEKSEKAFTDAIDAIDIKHVVTTITDNIEKSNEILASRYLLDIETTGLISNTRMGTSYPDVVQVALIDTQTEEIHKWLINNGDRNEANLQAYQDFLKKEGAEAADISVKQLNESRTLIDILTEIKNRVGIERVTAFNGTNLDKMGGAFDIRILRAVMGADFLNLGTDIIDILHKSFVKAFGKGMSYKLKNIYEVVAGSIAESAHAADADVKTALVVYRAALDGTLDEILELAKNTGDISRKGLLAAGKFYNENILKVSTDIAEGIVDASEEITDAGEVNTLDMAAESITGTTKTDKVVESISDTAKKIVSEIDELADGTAEAAARAASEMGTSGEKIASGVSSVADSVDEASKTAGEIFSETISTAYKRLTSGWQNIKNWFSRMSSKGVGFEELAEEIAKQDLIFDAFRKVREAAANLEPVKKIYDDAMAAAKIAAELGQKVNEFDVSAYAKVSGEYAKASDDFLKTIITATGESIKRFKAAGTENINIFRLIQGYTDQFKEGNKYFAYTVTSKTGELKLITESLDGTIDEVVTGIQKTFEDALQTAVKAAGIADTVNLTLFKAVEAEYNAFRDGNKVFDELTDIAKAVANTVTNTADTTKATFSEALDIAAKNAGIADTMSKANVEAALLQYKAYLEGAISADKLSDGAKALKTSFEKIGKTTVILDESSNALLYGGEAAVKNIDTTFKLISNKFVSVGQKLIDGVGTLGIFDVLDVAISGVVQDFKEAGKGKELQDSLLGILDISGAVTTLSESGLDIGKLIGDRVYKGVAEVLGQEVSVTLLGGLAGTLATVFTGGTAGIIAGATAAITSIVSSLGIEAIGGRTDASLYLDNYITLLEKGNLLSEEIIAEAKRLGVTTEKLKIIEEESKKILNRELIGTATGNIFEIADIEKLLYGLKLGNSGYGQDITLNDTSSEVLSLRLAEILGMVSSNTKNNGWTGTTSSQITPNNFEGIELLKELFGNTKVETAYTNENLEALKTALDMIYEQGVGTGYVAENILSNVEASKWLQKELSQMYGRDYEAIQLIDQFLAQYNTENGTTYSREEADVMGLSEQLKNMAIQMHDAIQALHVAQAEIEGKTDTKNRDITQGNVDSTVWGIDTNEISKVTQTTIDSLRNFGIAISTGATTWESEITGKVSEAFMNVSLSADKLKEHIAGWTIDTKDMIFDLGSASLSAEDIEILSQAGIQINGNGSVTFMKAMNEGVTGAVRELDASAETFSKAILDSLAGYADFNFETDELDFGDMSEVKDEITGALYKLPDNFLSGASDQTKAMVESAGDILASGYLMITDQAVLSGQQTLEGFLQGLSSNSDALKESYRKVIDPENVMSDEDFGAAFNKAFATFDPETAMTGNAIAALKNISDLINYGTADISQNIIDWANGIAIPSPFDASQLSQEEADWFATRGINFQKYGEEYLMIINQTGEHITDGIVAVDLEKWLGTDEKVLEALAIMGVKTQQVGNQMMVDLSGTFDKGIDDIIKLFVEQPDVWAQMPDTYKKYLVEAGVVSEGELITINKIMAGGLTEVSDGWIATWRGLTDETLAQQMETVNGTTTTLGDLSKAIDDGLLRVVKVVDENFDFNTLTDTQIAVPFEELPAEIADSLSATDTELRGKKIILENATSYAIEGMVAALQTGKEETAAVAGDMAKSIADAIKDALLEINKLTELQSQIGTSSKYDGWGLLGLATQTKNRTGTPVKGSNGVEYTPEYDANDNIIGYWSYGSTGWKRSKDIRFAKGGLADGLALTGEEGRELAITPDGRTEMLGAMGRGELVDLPEGTRVLNNKDTEDVIKYTGESGLGIRKLASGNADFRATDGNTSQKVLKAITGLEEAVTDFTGVQKTTAQVLQNMVTAQKHFDDLLAAGYEAQVAKRNYSDEEEKNRAHAKKRFDDLLAAGYKSQIAKRNLTDEEKLAVSAKHFADLVAAGYEPQIAKRKLPEEEVALKFLSERGSRLLPEELAAQKELAARQNLTSSIDTVATNLQRSQLQYARSLKDGGIPQTAHRTLPEEVAASKAIAEATAQKMLEHFLPILQNQKQASGDDRPLMLVGTLVADDKGLRELDRRMKVVTQKEERRR